MLDEKNKYKNYIYLKMDVSDIIKNYENTKLFQVLINIILVYNNARKATLVELNNFDENDIDEYNSVINKFIKYYELYTINDYSSDYRYFIVKVKTDIPKNENEIAELLEFNCIGHDYSNKNIIRVFVNIIEKETEEMIYAEVCEQGRVDLKILESNLIRKINKFNKVMEKNNLHYSFEYNIITEYPDNYYLDNYENKSFVEENLYKYRNILYNEYYDNSMFVQDPNLILTHFDIFKFIITKIKDKTFDEIYSNIKPLTPQYFQLMKEFENFDNKLFNM
jgi:hypothetical protein